MHLLAISLLTILAGTLLLAKFKKDTAGKFFACISWFFIVVGFILFIGAISCEICKMTHHGCGDRHSDCKQEMMMKDCDHRMQGGSCCPEGMDKGMCSKKPGCMPQEGATEGCIKRMEGCPKHMEGDSTKMPAQKE